LIISTVFYEMRSLKKMDREPVCKEILFKTTIGWMLLMFFYTSIVFSQKKEPLKDYVFPDFILQDTALCTSHSFVDFSKNNLKFYSNGSPNFDFFYHQFDSMIRFRDRALNFYHIGGSHVQADIYTNDIRTYLQTYYNDLPGTRGWVFPFSLAGTNNPSNYRFSSETNFVGVRASVRKEFPIDLGVLGFALISEDSIAQLSFNYRNAVSKPGISKIRIFHNYGYFPYEINFGTDEPLISSWFHNERNGYTEFIFSDELDSFDVQFVRTCTYTYRLELYGFQLLNDQPGVSYNAIGVNGAGLYSYLDCPYFEQQLSTLPPDFFVFAVGTNDANVPPDKFDPQIYKNNLEQMIKIVLRINPRCAVLLTVPNDSHYKRRSLNFNIARQREVIIELAKEYSVPVWDFYGIMGELGSSKIWQQNNLMHVDLIHFSSTGYHFKGDLFIDAFLKYLLQFSESDNQ